jgi:hypothetical protein
MLDGGGAGDFIQYEEYWEIGPGKLLFYLIYKI